MSFQYGISDDVFGKNISGNKIKEKYEKEIRRFNFNNDLIAHIGLYQGTRRSRG